MASSQVLKYPLHPGALLELPSIAVVRHVADQLGTVCLWAEVRHDVYRINRYKVLKAATGQEIPDRAMYLGTVLESHGQYVWHYYAVPA